MGFSLICFSVKSKEALEDGKDRTVYPIANIPVHLMVSLKSDCFPPVSHVIVCFLIQLLCRPGLMPLIRKLILTMPSKLSREIKKSKEGMVVVVTLSSKTTSSSFDLF